MVMVRFLGLFLFFFLLFASPAQAKKMSVAVLATSNSHWFWRDNINFMKAAAQDLGIRLEVFSNDYNRFTYYEQAKSIIARPDSQKPDYLLIGNEQESAQRVIHMTAGSGIKVFVYSNGFVRERTIAELGSPGGKYPHWIGQLVPNNVEAGYLMTKALIQTATDKGYATPENPLPLLAIGGTFNTSASSDRLEGMRLALKEAKDRVDLLQTVQSDWTKADAILKINELLKRYPQTRAVWGVNDSSALGALEVAEEQGKAMGEDFFTVGCGWYNKALPLVRGGKIAATVGGHFMDGAWALVMLYDHFHGHRLPNALVRSKMHILSAQTNEEFYQLINQKSWQKINFKAFSKTYHPEVKEYNFSFANLSKNLQEEQARDLIDDALIN